MTTCRVPVGLAGISLVWEEAFLSLVFLSAGVIFSAGNTLLQLAGVCPSPRSRLQWFPPLCSPAVCRIQETLAK